jgi:putative sterol carrier protein
VQKAGVGTAPPRVVALSRSSVVTLEEITDGVRRRVGAQSPLAAIVKFDFGDDGVVRIDGTTSPSVVDNENSVADCTLKVTPADFVKIASGAIKPKMAVMTGKLQVEGDVSLALRLGSLLRPDVAATTDNN